MLMQRVRDLVFGARPPAGNPLVDYLDRHPDGRLLHKWDHYFDIYHRHLARLRGQRLTLIEIGVFNGGSLQMWRDYLGPDATIVGVDVNPECQKFAERQIEVVIGDQANGQFLGSLANRYPDAAILIDDGGHRMHQQIATFEHLYPRLRPDGIYICEDTHSSYFPMFGGGYQQPQTFIETAKRLIDSLHAFHSQDHAQFTPDEFTRTHRLDPLLRQRGRVRESHAHQAAGDDFGQLGRRRYVGPSLSGKL